MSYTFSRLHEINDSLKRDQLDIRKYEMALLPGRSVPCAV